MIVARIAEVLCIESLIVTDGDVGDVALRIANSLVDRIDETFVGERVSNEHSVQGFLCAPWHLPVLRRFLRVCVRLRSRLRS